MSIEPTNVSKSAVREVEQPSSNYNAWTSAQGSSTSGKDRPNSSIWEKAITGAQKLFGVDSSSTAAVAEEAEDEDSTKANSQSETAPSFDSVPGFASRGFGRFRAGSTPSLFGSVSRNLNTGEFPSKDFSHSFDRDTEVSLSRNERSEKRGPSEAIQNRGQEAPVKEKPVVENDTTEEEEISNEQKSEKKIEATPLQKGSVAPVGLPVSNKAQGEPVQAASAVPQATVSQSNQVQAAPIEAQSAAAATPAPTSAMTAQSGEASKGMPNAQVATPTTTPKAQTPTQSPQQAQGVSQQPSLEVAGTKTTETSLKATPSQQLDTQVASKNPSVTTPLASETVKAEASPKSEAPVAETLKKSENDSLGFDAAKARETVSEGLVRSAKRGAATSAAQPQTSPASQTNGSADSRDLASRPQMSTDATTNRAPENAALDSNVTDAARREGAAAAAQQRAGSTRVANESAAQVRVPTGVETNASAQANQANQNTNPNFARDLAGAAASRNQTTATNTKSGNNVNGQANTSTSVAGAPGSTGSPPMQGAQKGGSQGQDGDAMAKQDLGAALKNATNAKGTEKAGDNAQSFEAKVETAESRRSEAAAKTKQTSYVSKTAAEVKEVIATLTKSIDRLVTDKLGTMNLKLNFEGGGSMNLRISMDAGQVNTVMLTDVSGLESAIKSNWSELANDWNQKGVKLNTPQFQNTEAGRDSSFENEFASRQERQADGRNGDGRTRSGGQSTTRNGNGQMAEGGGEAGNGRPGQDEVVSDSELKTYA